MQRRSGGRGLGAVLFTDIVGSTAVAAEMGNTRWSELVARHHRIVRRLIARFGGHEVDTAGDGFFVSFERPADAIRCAVAATEAVRELGIEIRAGVSFGELETAERKPSGLVVNTAARVMGVAGPGEVLVPASVKDLVPGAGISFADHGVHRLKGFEEEFRLFSVTGVDGREVEPPLEGSQAAERRREIFPTGARRRALLVGGGAGALALIVAASILIAGGEPPRRPGPTGPLRYAVARVDPDSGAVRSPIGIGAGPRYTGLLVVDHPIAAGEGGVWLLRPPTVIHVDPLHGEVRADRIDVGIGPSQAVKTGFDAVWVLSGRTLYRINPATDERDTFLVLPATGGISTYSLALSDFVWVGMSEGTLVRMDPLTQARDQIDTRTVIDAVAATKDGVWVVDILAGTASRFDASSLRPVGRPFEIRGSIDQVEAEGKDLWVLDRRVGTVARIDVDSKAVSGSARVGDEPTDMALGLGSVWVGDRDGSLYRIDTTTLEVEEVPIGAEVIGVAVDEAEASVWVYLGKATDGA